MKRLLSAVMLYLMASTLNAATEVTILEINTEFLFDHLPPHGQALGTPPTETEWKQKAKDIADIIENKGADIVGLIEVENESVVTEIKNQLPNSSSWNVVFLEGRDTYTGQDVALLTTYDSVQGSSTTFPDERDIYTATSGEKTTSPSKILGVTLKVEGHDVRVILAHLISQLRNNDAKRFAQATVIRRHAVMAMNDGLDVVVMGDMNDTPGEPAIRRLRGLDDIWGPMIQTANEVPLDDRYTYIYQGDESLLDHILLSPSLYKEFRKVSSNRRCEILDISSISDHRAIMARIKIESNN